MGELVAKSCDIDGLWLLKLPEFVDSRGSFVEAFQTQRLAEAGLPRFEPVQHNLSYNERRGVTRGIHAEPWDKLTTLVQGHAFVAIVDLRAEKFGQVECFELGPGEALFVPQGCGNSFQTLEDHTVYSYLVNDLWSADSSYGMVNLFDPELAIPWPVGSDQAIISKKDAGHPMLAEIRPR